MTLKEELLGRKQTTMINVDMDKHLQSDHGKRYQLFLKICARLEENVNLNDISCGTYKEVF